MPKITCPVLVIHGTEDEVIDFSHGLAIYEKCPRAVEPLWVEGAGHNDVELYGQYLERLKQFINIELSVNWQLLQLRGEDINVAGADNCVQDLCDSLSAVVTDTYTSDLN